MEVLSQAMYNARELAMTRMEEEADQLGADGVVGVRLEIGRYDWGPDLAEFIASEPRSSTARASCIARRTGGRSRATSRGRTSGRCCRAGTVRSASSWARASTTSRTSRCGRRCGTSARTSRWRTSRKRSTTRASSRWSGCRAEAKQLQAEGIVGVQLVERSHGWGSHVIEFFAVGTAITPVDGGALAALSWSDARPQLGPLFDTRSGTSDTGVMTAHSSRLPMGLAPLIAEAKDRMRRRRSLVALLDRVRRPRGWSDVRLPLGTGRTAAAHLLRARRGAQGFGASGFHRYEIPGGTRSEPGRR